MGLCWKKMRSSEGWKWTYLFINYIYLYYFCMTPKGVLGTSQMCTEDVRWTALALFYSGHSALTFPQSGTKSILWQTLSLNGHSPREQWGKRWAAWLPLVLWLRTITVVTEKPFFASCRLLPCDILCLANSPSSCVLFPLGVGEGWPKESGGSESEGNHKDTWEGRDPETQRWRKQTWSIGCSWHNYFSYSLVSFQAEEVVGHGQCYLQTEVALVKNSLSMWGKDLQHPSHKLTESYLYLWPITASLHSTSLIPCASWKDRMPME